MSKSKIIAGIEIGTAKIAVLVGEVHNGNSLNIIGFGESSSRGVMKGVVYDFKQAGEATHAAIHAAEKQAGAHIEGVYLAQTGAHIDGFYNEAGVSVSSASNLVAAEDIRRVCESAKAKALPEDRTVIHHIRRPFRIDGRMVPDPEYLEGSKLEVGYWIVHGSVKEVGDAIRIVNGFSLHVDDIILSSLASGVMVASDDEMRNGVLVVDIGCGATDFVFYRDGYVVKTGTLPVGGDHVTNDLGLGLRVTRRQAETIKVNAGKAVLDPADRGKKIWLNGDLSIGDRQVPREAINKIAHARVEELFELVKKKLGESFTSRNAAAGVILTGGGARLNGMAQVAEEVFGVTSRVGENPPWVTRQLRGIEYSTVLGLLNYGLKNEGDRDAGASRAKPGGLLRRMTKIFDRT
jgi:cell division protein FtsA